MQLSASLVTFTRIAMPYPTPSMVAMGVEDWPTPVVLQAIPSVNDGRRMALLERFAEMERSRAFASERVKQDAREFAADARRLRGENADLKHRLTQVGQGYQTFVQQLVAQIGDVPAVAVVEEPPPAPPPLRAPRGPSRPGLSPAALAIFNREPPDPIGLAEAQRIEDDEGDEGAGL